MKRIFAILLAIILPTALLAQVQITTKKEKLSDFPEKTMMVVLSGKDFVDQSLKEAVKNTWTLSPFEFCGMDEFKSMMTNEDYYFMLAVKYRYKKENEPGVTWLNIVKGKANAVKISDLLEVVSFPVYSSIDPSGREAVYLNAITDIMQAYISKSLNSKFSGISPVGLGKAGKKDIVICDEDLSSQIRDKERAKLEKKGVLVAGSELTDSLFMEAPANTLFSYTVAPSNPDHQGGFCYKMFFDSRSHELYYYRKHKLGKNAGAGLLKSDIGKVLGTRK